MNTYLLKIKKIILSSGLFTTRHMGMYIRSLYFEHYLKKIITLKKDGNYNILDAGCGRGSYASFIAKYFNNSKIEAIDIKKHKEWEKSCFKNLYFSEGDLLEFNKESYYDLIYSIDVLEHIQGNKKVMANFYRGLKKGGYLYLAVPCEATEFHIFPKKWFKEFNEWSKIEHIGEQYPLNELKKILKDIGFEITVSRYTFTSWGHFCWEMETLLRGKKTGDKINLILMPFYKFLAYLDLYFPLGKGNNLIVAKKL